jgi:hypothetical protein
MLNNNRQNYHHSTLPKLGDIVQPGILSGWWIVTSFNLCDNVLPYSRGIHLVNIEKLSDRNINATISGFYCVVN